MPGQAMVYIRYIDAIPPEFSQLSAHSLFVLLVKRRELVVVSGALVDAELLRVVGMREGPCPLHTHRHTKHTHKNHTQKLHTTHTQSTHKAHTKHTQKHTKHTKHIKHIEAEQSKHDETQPQPPQYDHPLSLSSSISYVWPPHLSLEDEEEGVLGVDMSPAQRAVRPAEEEVGQDRLPGHDL